MFGRRPCRKAVTTSSSWCLSIGQPRSSKSTGTWSAIAVEVASVEMNCWCRVNSRDVTRATSAKFFSAWIPPAVAQAPIVISVFDCFRTWRIRSASCAVVIEPSTSDTSYGPGFVALDASRK